MYRKDKKGTKMENKAKNTEEKEKQSEKEIEIVLD